MEPKARWTKEEVLVEPGERRAAVAGVIRSAQYRLRLSLFRCDDAMTLAEFGRAVKRNVLVEVLLTPRAKGWDRRLKDLGARLRHLGVHVLRYKGPSPKYHAKYLVADDKVAIIASLNLTKKCFERTCDFVVVTPDAGVVSSLIRLFEADSRAAQCLPGTLSERLILGPERARKQICDLLRKARRSIRIIDHRANDPNILSLLARREAAGIRVEILGHGAFEDYTSHGKLILIDEDTAVVGSISLSPQCLDSRRELAVTLRGSSSVRRLNQYYYETCARWLEPAYVR